MSYPTHVYDWAAARALRKELDREDKLDRILTRVTKHRGKPIDYGKLIAVPFECSHCGKQKAKMVPLRALVHENYVAPTMCEDVPF